MIPIFAILEGMLVLLAMLFALLLVAMYIACADWIVQWLDGDETDPEPQWHTPEFVRFTAEGGFYDAG